MHLREYFPVLKEWFANVGLGCLTLLTRKNKMCDCMMCEFFLTYYIKPPLLFAVRQPSAPDKHM
jgi:hypothetical protein